MGNAAHARPKLVPSPDGKTKPRLIQYEQELSGGQICHITKAGGDKRGVIVLLHGCAAEGPMYGLTMLKLARQGYLVIAPDVPGHGGTPGLKHDRYYLGAYVEWLTELLEALEVKQVLIAGHSMGGTLALMIVAQLIKAGRSDLVRGLVLIDAAVGEPWDTKMAKCRNIWRPDRVALLCGHLFLDCVLTLPRRGKLAAQTMAAGLHLVKSDLSHPWNLLAPGIAMLLAKPSAEALEEVRDSDIPVWVIHGSRDTAVPFATAYDAAQRSGAELIVVDGGKHSWILTDPAEFPHIMEYIEGESISMAGTAQSTPYQVYQPTPQPRYPWHLEEVV